VSFSHHLLRVTSASSCGALSQRAANNVERFSVLPVACTLGWHDVPCREAELQAPATPTSLCAPRGPACRPITSTGVEACAVQVRTPRARPGAFDVFGACWQRTPHDSAKEMVRMTHGSQYFSFLFSI